MTAASSTLVDDLRERFEGTPLRIRASLGAWVAGDLLKQGARRLIMATQR